MGLSAGWVHKAGRGVVGAPRGGPCVRRSEEKREGQEAHRVGCTVDKKQKVPKGG